MEAHDLALAYSLSTIAGLRAAFMLLVVSAAIHLNLLHPSPAMTWMGSDQTLLVTGLSYESAPNLIIRLALHASRYPSM